MPVQKFVSLKQIAEVLNYTEGEVKDLMGQRRIPVHIRRVGAVVIPRFPLQEVLKRITPRKTKPKPKPKPKPKVKPEEVKHVPPPVRKRKTTAKKKNKK